LPRNEKLQLKGQLRVSCSLAFARLVLAPLLGEFTRDHPGLRLSFELSDGYVDIVEKGIDLAIRIGELQDSTLKALKIGITRRSLYASNDYIKKFGKPKTVDELKKHNLLYYTRIGDQPCWPLHTKEGKPTPYYFEPYLQADGSDLTRELMLLGMGISFSPTWMMRSEMESKMVVRILEKHSKSSLSIYAVTSSTQEMTVKQRAFTNYLIKEFDKNPELTLRGLSLNG
jgi:LysR family transcriptional regulator for bpeEF and oprC